MISLEDTNTRRILLWSWLCLLLAASLSIRFILFDFESTDYQMFLSPWYDFIVEHGGFRALKYDFTAYGLPYLYFMVLATWLPVQKIYAIKLISVVFDYVAAYFIYKIVSLKYGKGFVAIYAVCVALFLPTVVFNSSVWGQCDVIYTSAFLACLYWVLKRRPVPALVAFGAACSLKPQAVFFAPLLCGLMLNGRIPWRLIFIPPAVFLLSGIPALLVGRPIQTVLLTHIRLGNLPKLALSAPNVYQFILENYYQLLKPIGLAVTMIICLWFILSMKKWPAKSQGNLNLENEQVQEQETILVAALVSTMIVPYFLPQMHDRYFFPADVISLVYAFYFPRRLTVAVLIQFASFFSYFPYCLKRQPIPMFVLAVVMTTALWLVVTHYIDLIQSVRKNREKIPSNI